jgi:hypothetical protein
MVARDLPPCAGPKLGPFVFQGQDQDIIFKKHLGSAVHSHVFEVIINGSAYALKMVGLSTYLMSIQINANSFEV